MAKWDDYQIGMHSTKATIAALIVFLLAFGLRPFGCHSGYRGECSGVFGLAVGAFYFSFYGLLWFYNKLTNRPSLFEDKEKK